MKGLKPLIKGSTVVAFVLVFIDMIKELPITLIVRPFNYDTLSTRMYEYISDERFKEAALPSIVIITISLTLLLVIFDKMSNKRQASAVATSISARSSSSHGNPGLPKCPNTDECL